MELGAKNIFFLILILFFLQCTDRKRLNPIDPQNPKTAGKVTGLKIFSEFKKITVSWHPVEVDNMLGYRIYRKISGEPSFSPIHLASKKSAIFYDNNVTYGKKYTYNITVVTSGYESPASDSIGIEPGPTVIWMTDVSNRYIIKVSHDGLHEIGRISVDGYPWALTLNPNDRSIWYCDVLYGDIIHITDNKRDVFRAQSVPSWKPMDIAVNSINGVVWIAGEKRRVIRIPVSASEGFREISNDDFIKPRSVVVKETSRQCCMVDELAKAVFYISTNGNTILKSPVNFIHPMAITVNQSDGSCWVADSSRVVKLSDGGGLALLIEDNFQFVTALDVNSNTGELWIVDFGTNARIIKFDEHGNKLLEVSGFHTPEAIKVNPADNGCVFVDTGNGRLVRLSSQGKVLSELRGYYYLRGLFVEYSLIR